MTSAVQLLLVLSVAYYAFFILRSMVGLRSASARQSANLGSGRSVSVIIPARNEETTITRCLDAVCAQDLASDKVEIIVVDDASTDRTAEIVSSYGRKDERVRLIQLGPEARPHPSKKRGRKPEALAAAIDQASGEIIVTTDADCISPPTWLRTLCSFLDDETVYVVGPVLERHGSSLLTKIRSLEVLGFIALSGGRIGAGRPINGHGGNTAFYKHVYTKVGGFDFDAVKSDEETLLHEVRIRRLGSIAFAGVPEARIHTSSPPTFQSYWNQRMRWGSMHGRFSDRMILAELIALYLSLLVPLASLIAGWWYPPLLTWSLGALLLKACVDLYAVRSASQLFGEPFSWTAFACGELFHGAVILTVSTVAQFLPYRWKERTVLAVDSSSKS